MNRRKFMAGVTALLPLGVLKRQAKAGKPEQSTEETIKWIDVRDRLPELFRCWKYGKESHCVLVNSSGVIQIPEAHFGSKSKAFYTEYPIVREARLFWYENTDEIFWNTYDLLSRATFRIMVSHWAELPKGSNKETPDHSKLTPRERRQIESVISRSQAR